MRVLLASLMVLVLAGCSREPAKQEAPPAAAPATASFALTLSAPNQLSVPQGSPIQISAGNGVLRLQGYVTNPSAQMKTDGASVALGAVNERAFADHRVRVTFRARGVDGATHFTSAYSTHGNGNSGWRTLRVTNELRDVSFDFDVPPFVRAQDDFVGIVPPETGAIEIQSIRVAVVAP